MPQPRHQNLFVGSGVVIGDTVVDCARAEHGVRVTHVVATPVAASTR